MTSNSVAAAVQAGSPWLDITLSRGRAIYILARLAVLSTVLAMSAGMINQEGVNVDLYIPRKCAAVLLDPTVTPHRESPEPSPNAWRFLLRLLIRVTYLWQTADSLFAADSGTIFFSAQVLRLQPPDHVQRQGGCAD